MDTVQLDEAEHLPARLCEAISALPHSITASVGAAVAPVDAIVDRAPAIDKLVYVADTAMYCAKRNGGNQAVVETMSHV